MSNTEVAVFTENTKQRSHYHLRGSEIYMVLEGLMPIELEGEIYRLGPEDMIIVIQGQSTKSKKREQIFSHVS